MNIRERVRGAMRRAGEVSLWERLAENLFGGAGSTHRRTWGAGSNLAPISTQPGLPGNISRAGAPAPHSLVLKPTPVNLRRFSENPVARRAVHVIKDPIAGIRWRLQAPRGPLLASRP